MLRTQQTKSILQLVAHIFCAGYYDSFINCVTGVVRLNRRSVRVRPEPKIHWKHFENHTSQKYTENHWHQHDTWRYTWRYGRANSRKSRCHAWKNLWTAPYGWPHCRASVREQPKRPTSVLQRALLTEATQTALCRLLANMMHRNKRKILYTHWRPKKYNKTSQILNWRKSWNQIHTTSRRRWSATTEAKCCA